MPKRGGRRRKRRTHKEISEAQYDEVPKSLIMKRSVLTKDMKHFEQNLREMMYPFTALKFKENLKLKMKDILAATKNFGVANLMFLTSKEKGNYLKLLKVPCGPTITFKIEKYSLSKDLQKLILRNKTINCNQLGVPMVIC